MSKREVLVACATNDLETLIEDHFGEARYFMVFRLNPGRWEHLEDIPNRVSGVHDHAEGKGHRHGHGHGHGEGAKARAILEHFRERKVEVFISRRFGPNITVIREYVLPVVVREVARVEEGLSLCRKNFPELVRQLELPVQERIHLVLNPDM